MPRVLVTYATRYGSTAEIAAVIGRELADAGFEVDVLHAGPEIQVARYDAVVAGAPSYGRKWLPAAAVFVVSNRETLARMPVALFTVGTLGVKNPKSALREHNGIVATLSELAPGLEPVSTALFHGSFSRKNLPFLLKLLDWVAGTPQGDHRDWEAIRSWTHRVGELFTEAMGQASEAVEGEGPEASEDETG